MGVSSASRWALLIVFAVTAAQAIGADPQADKGQAVTTTSTSASKELSAPPPRPTRAVGKLVCSNKTYKISTGTGGGSCLSGVSDGECKDGNNGASATCKSGCGTTTGKGTCTTE